MKMLRILFCVFLMIAGILIDTIVYGNFGCKNYKKTYTRDRVKSEPKGPNGTPRHNNWITYAQMEARREERWQARMKRLRDQKKEAQAVVAE